jgi:hypothetical protein
MGGDLKEALISARNGTGRVLVAPQFVLVRPAISRPPAIEMGTPSWLIFFTTEYGDAVCANSSLSRDFVTQKALFVNNDSGKVWGSMLSASAYAVCE